MVLKVLSSYDQIRTLILINIQSSLKFMNNKMAFSLEALCYSALPAQTGERAPAARKKTKIKTSQFSKKIKLKISNSSILLNLIL
jgi:hypothetical protein